MVSWHKLLPLIRMFSLEQMQIDGVARVETLDELLKKSDIVSVHMSVRGDKGDVWRTGVFFNETYCNIY